MKKSEKTAMKPQQTLSPEVRMAELRQIIAQDEALLITYPKDKNLKADLANLRKELQELEQLEQPQEQQHSL